MLLALELDATALTHGVENSDDTVNSSFARDKGQRGEVETFQCKEQLTFRISNCSILDQATRNRQVPERSFEVLPLSLSSAEVQIGNIHVYQCRFNVLISNNCDLLGRMHLQARDSNSALTCLFFLCASSTGDSCCCHCLVFPLPIRPLTAKFRGIWAFSIIILKFLFYDSLHEAPQ